MHVYDVPSVYVPRYLGQISGPFATDELTLAFGSPNRSRRHVVPRLNPGSSRSIVIMDNAKIHAYPEQKDAIH
ncbi:Transposase [Phytophthora palmivora]|uniref:Transposase n=1 Tax=Phytophthora palmivora TaxID=4796 RepID=A0A2P4XRG9_9STRA|nr:Transposase [Phytophthora palmivora]